MISPSETKTAYESWHDRLEVDHLAGTPWHSLVKAHLQAADITKKTILEIGCGRGGFACWLGRQDPPPKRIVAADFSQTAVQKGRAYSAQNGLDRIRWEVMDIEAIAHKDETFDTVISCETVEHVLNPSKAVKELARVLKPGGRLYLTTPNYMGSMGLYRIYLGLCGRRYTEEGQPINQFMLLPRTRNMILAAGLRVAVIDGVGHYLPIKGRRPVELRFLNNPRSLMRWFGLHSLVTGEKVRKAADHLGAES
jgi:2-polyprenyl-3-methyl-5-hydroxy-6-metoxy-1,4-benzoquinol methylase